MMPGNRHGRLHASAMGVTMQALAGRGEAGAILAAPYQRAAIRVPARRDSGGGEMDTGRAAMPGRSTACACGRHPTT